MENNLNWIDFYMEFASKLLEYQYDRKTLIEKIVTVYDQIGINLPKLETNEVPYDIDPFTVYGLFNKGITNANRISIITAIAKEFHVDAAIPDSFDGIPVLNNQKATFYWFEGGRGDRDIDNLWDVFSKGLNLAEHDSAENRIAFVSAYDRVLVQKGVRWNITMGLYWIRPYFFLNLDSTNLEFIRKPDSVSSLVAEAAAALRTVPMGNEYLGLCDKCVEAFNSEECRYHSFPELSYNAWLDSNETRGQKTVKEKKSRSEFLRWFRPLIVALRDLGGSATPEETRKKIIENEDLSQEEITETRGKTGARRFDNNVAFARNYLKDTGYIDGTTWGIWKLTEKGWKVDMTGELAVQIQKDVTAGRKDIEKQEINALGDSDVDTVHFWLYAPGEGASRWDECYNTGTMCLGWPELGDLDLYNSKAEIADKLKELRGGNTSFKNSAHAVWQFVHDLKTGDVIFVKKGRTEILGRGTVVGDYEFDEEKNDYPNIRTVKWTHKGNWKLDEPLTVKTLTDVSNYPDTVSMIEGFFNLGEETDEEETPVISYGIYTEEDFLNEVFMEESAYHTIVDELKEKKCIILKGAPGVGKTFISKRLAYSIMGVKDINRVMMVQFHQSYSYEDFIQGFRPSEKGFILKNGTFYDFCKKAQDDTENDYFFIIDELNRGNLSKIFGELFMLIDGDKRGSRNKIKLLYSGEYFYVPENLYIIGMMNTADRSIAVMDYAFLRRFGLIDLYPGFGSERFREYQQGLDSQLFNRLIHYVERLNEVIGGDASLGEGFKIGHSFFCNLNSDNVNQRLPRIVEYELIQTLKEYWFDEPSKVREWSDTLRGALK